MSPKLTRRDFLKFGALTATTAVVSGCTINLQRTERLESYVLPPEEGLPGENLWYASTCRQCAAGCGIIVRTSEGRARKIEGNPLHPVNQGKLCARGQAALQELYDPDRMQSAVQQTGGRGSLQFQARSWEDALQTLLEELRAVAPGAVAFLGGNPSSHLARVVQTFVGALGDRPALFYNLADELEGRPALIQSSQQLFGTAALPLFDVANADVVLSFGANFLETWLSPVSYSRAYARMRRGPLGRRGYLVQFEPRLSGTAASADEWVAIRPGTEGLLALALGRIIAEQGPVRAEHSALYEGVDVAEVATVSGVPLERLEKLAGLFASVPRSVAIPGGALAAQDHGIAAITAVQALNHLRGQLGQPGGVLLPATTGREDLAPPARSTFAQVHSLIQDMAGGHIRVLFIHGTDPVFELPAAAGFAEALANVPLVVSFSSTVNDSAAQADWILPDHSNLESWGYHVPEIADRPVVSGLQPVVRPLYETRATADVLLALARELGGAVGEALPWRNEVEFLRDVTGAWRDAETSAEAFWAAWRRQGGWWPADAAYRTAEAVPSFGGPLNLAAPAHPNEDEFFLHLYPSITLFDGRGANKPWLQETPDPMTTVSWQTWIEVHPHTAERLGLEDNDIVKVTSPVGEIEAIVYRYPGIREDVVAMPVGRGHEHFGRFATWGWGSNPLKLLEPVVDSDTGALAWGSTRVWLEPTGRRHPLARLESAEGVEYLRGEGH